MARITSLSPEETLRRYREAGLPPYSGFVKGLHRVLFVDPKIAGPVGQVYGYLNLRPDAPLTRLQREMLATVVNGLVGGAP